MLSDLSLTCRDCGRTFLFSAGEQQFFTERNFVPPTRCPACRATRRATRQDADGVSLERAGFASGQPRPLFPATCADCGRDTMVPFEPRPGRTVYCRDCYQQHRNDPRD
jgi:CxxC-x17-CxxC domain-containing protein